ncbi:Kcnf1 [Symbiodinium natans]|uniref:Kcnf1 protein n=1 Tax=Symbiodinium natans TaxID=878477 RepID=A0A812LLJ0_9DINO|nr:Kcnf1 [Symbiodinium natans]
MPGTRRVYRAPSKPKGDGYLPVIPSNGPLRTQPPVPNGTEGHLSPPALPESLDSPPHRSSGNGGTMIRMATSGSLGDPHSYHSFREMRDVSGSECEAGDLASEEGEVGRRRVQQARSVDLKVAWRMHGKQLRRQLDEETQPLMRLVYRSRADYVWELLDDANSSVAAWWISTFLKLLVLSSLLVTNLQTSDGICMHPVLAAVLETSFDSIFLLEFTCRLLSAPSKKAYLADLLNWPDMLSATGLPLRASIGLVFVVPHTWQQLSSTCTVGRSTPPSSEQAIVQGILLFLLPLVRFLKLLRYFDSFRLLIDACRNSAESLPVLTYLMAVITFFSATAIYLLEPRENIPTMQHSLWLAIVTMTTVGYGDFYPVSLGGYVSVSILTFVSVLFLALPVGIIGHEFTMCWQNRDKVLLLTRIRKGLRKWGYSAKDLKILFRYVDADEDGSLNIAEFMELVRQMRVGVTADSALHIFQLFDDDASGSIDYGEFLRHVFPDDYVKDQQQKGGSIISTRGKAEQALHHLEMLRVRTSEEAPSIDSLAD